MIYLLMSLRMNSYTISYEQVLGRKWEFRFEHIRI